MRSLPILQPFITLFLIFALAQFASSDPGDKQGWSLQTDPRKRAFLVFAPAKDGPRVLTVGCLRDVDSFTVVSTAVPPNLPSGSKVTLTLSNGDVRYAVAGEIEPIEGAPTFNADIDADASMRGQIGRALLPILEGRGPITLTIGSLRQELPVAGLSQVLGRFKSVCFAGR